ncbi:EAL domain-containing protein [Altererythrobacter sp. CC-YST694]|uniref:putative bifunctional diguanylate cyclase/phosphodiesterase n=1 Tax=Altererythrobacter sp. CC-YST694 TaxID=2755038 RepID=UPI001D01DA09|nr:EAL domain-containing protein [Altererythrobacter sp. CC-YST694]MCB5424794.1 EAL domain-containing protein [Altererythrobacter sp. CC-YST694]
MSMRGKPFEGLAAWLLGARTPAPPAIYAELTKGLFASLPIFLGGVINTTAVAGVAAWRQPYSPFIAWFLFEIALGLTRIAVLVRGRAVQRNGGEPPRFLAALLSCCWATSVGIGTALCLDSGDWLLASIAGFSAAGMVCGVCLRNFGTPRLSAIMCFLILAPCGIVGVFSDESLLTIIALQLPFYMFTIFAAGFSLQEMLVSRMTALSDLQRSETLNETILKSSPDRTLILDSSYRILFSNIPNGMAQPEELVGLSWPSLIPPEERDNAIAALRMAESGLPGNVLTHQMDRNGQCQWFDVIANRISDDSGRIIVVARDITHQKKSEEHALWMAHHDALTGLPNRALLQGRLEDVLTDFGASQQTALLILDVDNFKTINDALGHDAGDILLCTFASRLRAAVNEGDLVARTGGDEFAVIVSATTEDDVIAAADQIFDQLREPFYHEGRLLECRASIGASMIPRDGISRSEIMKAADIALYAAKAGGRARLKLFEPAMMVEVERHQSMIASARRALQANAIIPHYQPKVSLGNSRIVGFEALLRWRDPYGRLQGPDVLKAAFEDPALSGPLSDRMLDGVLHDMRDWLSQGLDFGHVAINVTAADFRRGSFAERLLGRLEDHGVPPSCIQIEVTETVFLGRGASYVEDALKHLNAHGILIALDDFGTGYASLSHLNQFPVDLLKIDRSFVGEIGCNPDAEAISTTVINLGHCLGLEVIAEGVETRAQEAYLATVGCDTGQGYLYSEARPAHAIPSMLREQPIPAVRA